MFAGDEFLRRASPGTRDEARKESLEFDDGAHIFHLLDLVAHLHVAVLFGEDSLLEAGDQELEERGVLQVRFEVKQAFSSEKIEGFVHEWSCDKADQECEDGDPAE